MFQLVSNRFLPIAVAANIRRSIALTVMSVTLVACSSDDSDPASPLRTGVFLDAAAVEGLNFTTDTMSGKTNADGEFSFNAGETVSFNLGGFALPSVQGAAIVSPRDIFGASDVADQRVADLSRLLQSLDVDSNTSNGILLPIGVESLTSDTVIEFGETNFDAQAALVLSQINGAAQTDLVDTNTAEAGLTESLIDNNLISDGCSSDHRFVGRSIELSDLQGHGVSGTITVLDDCVLEVTNFNYDGGGPAVYFYAATDRSFSGDTFKIGPRLDNQRWVNDTIRLTLLDGQSLDDFNILSVWCFEFDINFGDALFEG